MQTFTIIKENQDFDYEIEAINEDNHKQVKNIYIFLIIKFVLSITLSFMSINWRFFLNFQKNHIVISLISTVLAIILILLIIFLPTQLKKKPWSLVVIILFVLCDSYNFSLLTAFISYTATTFLISTLIITCVLSFRVFGSPQKLDYLENLPFFLLVISGVSIISSFLLNGISFIGLLFTGIMAFLYSYNLVFNSNLVLFGRYKEIDVKELEFCQVLFYLDCLHFFKRFGEMVESFKNK